MFCIMGLGNPEKRYEGTRHNLGFDVVECLAERLRIPFKDGKGEYLIALGDSAGTPVALIKPMTYMNESGVAAADVCEQLTVPLEQLLVVCDDFQLPLGHLRLRLRGSDGGHNGLYSVIYHLQSDGFPRLRCGIASPSMPKEKDRMAEFVLERFETAELLIVRQMVENAAEASLVAIRRGLTTAMNEFNKRVTPEEDSPTP
ncbi:MAG TPA: aminoacyl-tRNA hydrolase [Bacteroidetes bacterium]|nr:aminoacyl-tRNA hydrolase [Bacteroidota bacterium]